MKDDKKNKLTDKQKVFCREYLVDFNGTRAAIASGYSNKTAGQQSAENLKKPYIQEEIRRLADELNKTHGNSIERIILELQLIAFGDYQDLVEWDEYGIRRWIPSSELGDKSRLVQEISETTTQNGGSRKIKMHDKMRALEMLGRYHKIFTDKVDLTNSDGSLRPVVNLIIPSNGREAKE